jgi:YVTN family beta-propeller protein
MLSSFRNRRRSRAEDLARRSVAAMSTLAVAGLAITASGLAQSSYVRKACSKAVSVIETATNMMTAMIPAGSWPVGVAVAADGTNVMGGSSIPVGRSLYGTDIPSDLVAALQKDLTQDKDYDKLYKSCFADSHTSLLAEHVVAWRLDLNRPQQIALALRGRNCLGGNDNGELYLYIQAGNGWRQLLHTWGQSLYVCAHEVPLCRLKGGFERRSTSRYGWPDLAIWRHNSAHDGDQLVFHFDGKRYKAIACHRVSYQNPHGKPNLTATYSPCLLSSRNGDAPRPLPEILVGDILAAGELLTR